MFATGLAPIVNTSRKIPPTPVAAPWYGSIKDGWLCDSILKTAASPSPMSMTPAFSPGPCITQAAFVGKRFRCGLDDLYEQCSLHMTENMPSSVYVGVRPSILSILSYSSVESPCETTSSGVISGSFFVFISAILFKLHWSVARQTARVLEYGRMREH